MAYHIYESDRQDVIVQIAHTDFFELMKLIKPFLKTFYNNNPQLKDNSYHNIEFAPTNFIFRMYYGKADRI